MSQNQCACLLFQRCRVEVSPLKIRYDSFTNVKNVPILLTCSTTVQFGLYICLIGPSESSQ